MLLILELTQREDIVYSLKLELEDIIEATKKGQISEQESIQKLNVEFSYKQQSEDIKEYAKTKKYNERNVGTLITSHTSDPADIVLEKERLNTICDLWEQLQTVLTERQVEILTAFVETNGNYSDIARRFNITKAGVNKTLKLIRGHVSKLDVDFLDLCKEALTPAQSTFVAVKPSGMGQPYEREMCLPIGSSWQTRFGKQVYTTKNICHIPEYLTNTNSDSICTICEFKCTRLKEFPEQPKPSQEHQDKIMAIIAKNRVAA